MLRMPFARLFAPVLLIASGGVLATPATAATCASGDGVSIIVDSGNGIRTGCAPGDPATAWAALESAGFRLEGTQRFPASFICRINGYPAPADEPCVQTPPTTAYWALWSGAAGGGWTYSSTGATTLNPAPGSTVGVAFGAGREPGMAPASPTSTTSTTPPPATSSPPSSSPASSTTKPAGPNSSTRSTTSPATSSTPAPGSTGTSAGPGSSSTASRSATGTASDSASASDTTAIATSTTGASSTTGGTAAGTASPSSPTDAPSAAAAPAPGDGANPAVIVAGGAGIGLLLVGGAYVVRRQRDRARGL